MYQYETAAGMTSDSIRSSPRIDCTAGCSVEIPTEPGRSLYYQVERTDREETRSRLSAVQAVPPVAEESR
jgi:hypothetical protein